MNNQPKQMPDEFAVESGQRLKSLRAGKGLTQSEVAHAIEYDVSHLSRAERGVQPIEGKFLIALCKFFEVPTSYFQRKILPQYHDESYEFDERYPNRGLAIRIAESDTRIEREAISRVASIAYHSLEDPSVVEWLDTIRRESDGLRHERKFGYRLGESERDPDDDEDTDKLAEARRQREARRRD